LQSNTTNSPYIVLYSHEPNIIRSQFSAIYMSLFAYLKLISLQTLCSIYKGGGKLPYISKSKLMCINENYKEAEILLPREPFPQPSIFTLQVSILVN
jgi:hypothetical protein